MQIQVNTDHNIEGRQGLILYVTGVVENGLSHVSQHITRVEVHLADENGKKSGVDDKRCVMEARIKGRQPLAVTAHSDTLGKAADSAVEKLARVVQSAVERMHE